MTTLPAIQQPTNLTTSTPSTLLLQTTIDLESKIGCSSAGQSAHQVSGLANRTFWQILNAIKNIEVLCSLINAGVLPKPDLIQRLKSVAEELQEPLTATRTQIDQIESQNRMLKHLLSASYYSSIGVPGSPPGAPLTLPEASMASSLVPPPQTLHPASLTASSKSLSMVQPTDTPISAVLLMPTS